MTREDFAVAFDVSRETLLRFDTYAAQLAKWNRSINLVAPKSLEAVWQRHFADSAQLLDHAPAAARSWIDLGAGAGFPGLVIAMLRPDLRVTLIESDRRKAVFLRETARLTGTEVTVIAERIEAVEAQADIVSARALAPLGDLLALAAPFVGEGGRLLFLKGERASLELTGTRDLWHMEAALHPSRTDPRGHVLAIAALSRRKRS